MNDEQKIANIRKLLADPFAGHGLTKKEAEAARLVGLGFTWLEAAEKFDISTQALSARLKGARKKLKIENSKQLTKEVFKRLAAILNASSEGIVEEVITGYFIKNPLDEHTCLHCRAQEGMAVETVEEASVVPFKECFNETGCRCFVAHKSEGKAGG